MSRRRRRRSPLQEPGPPRVPKNCPPELHRQIGGREVPTRPAETLPPSPLRELTRAKFRALLLSMGFPTYQAYLWSPAWLEARRSILKRARGRCEDCGSPATQVHHLVYTEANVRLDTFEGLMALCRACHDRRHLSDFSDTFRGP